MPGMIIDVLQAEIVDQKAEIENQKAKIAAQESQLAGKDVEIQRLQKLVSQLSSN